MKTSYFYKILILLITIVTIVTSVSCNDSKSELKYHIGDYIAHYEDIEGLVFFDNILEEWGLSVHIPGTIDEVYQYYPRLMANEFKKDGKKVLFSGDVYNIDYNNSIQNVKSFMIELSSIRERKADLIKSNTGYWLKDEYINLTSVLEKGYYVQEKISLIPLSLDEVKTKLLSMGVMASAIKPLNKGFLVKISERPSNEDFFVSDIYVSSPVSQTGIIILPQLVIQVKQEESLAHLLSKYEGHLDLHNSVEDGPTNIYILDCYCFTSAEVLDMIAVLHEESAIIFCEPIILTINIMD